MGTRCNIIFKKADKKVFIYHHWDGYPEGVGANLKRFLTDYGFFGEYEQSIYSAVNCLIKAINYDYLSPNYELTGGIHGDIEYLYVADFDTKELKCYERKSFEEEFDDFYKEDHLVEIPNETEKEE